MMYLSRVGYVVLSTTVLSIALALWFGLTPLQAVLFAIPVCVGFGSLFTMWIMAREGSRGDARRQIIILLIIELVFVPIASTAAVVAYFIDPPDATSDAQFDPSYPRRLSKPR